MKRNINQIVLLCSLIFNVPFLGISQAQQITKSFTSEIDVTGVPNIEIEDPKDFDYSMQASLSSSFKEGIGYVLKPNENSETPYLIIPNYKIKTWEKNTIKQEIVIEIIPDKNTPNDAKKLLENLAIKIKKKRKNNFVIDGNMNIKKMELVNGFFRRDRNTYILEDGSSYNVRQLVIKSKVNIPIKSNIQFNSGYVGVEMGDLDGKLTINAEYGYIKAGNIKEIAANFEHFDAVFKDIGQMNLNAAYSKINANTIEVLNIGSLELLNQKPKKTKTLFHYDRSHQSLSFSNNYFIEKIGKLLIRDSGSDQFNLGSIGHFQGFNTSFSNFKIKKLEKTLELTNKNGDIIIAGIAPDFEHLNITNQTSTIELNMNQVFDYQLVIEDQFKTDLTINSELQKMDAVESWGTSYFRGKKNEGGTVKLNCHYCEIVIH